MAPVSRCLERCSLPSSRIAVISEDELSGERVIDVAGLVVAPGFIDMHEHGQTDEAYGLMVRDGVTAALELEVGTGTSPSGMPPATAARSSTTASASATFRCA